ncbi:MAG TPA: DsrE family protein [Chloroflexota bacterium]|nr:DsrE family protein [Chloroflexota bacterium]
MSGEKPTMGRLAAIVASGGVETMAAVIRDCSVRARQGMQVRVLFRDESIPMVCVPDARRRILAPSVAAEIDANRDLQAGLEELRQSGDVELYACTSSMYVWGITDADLGPAISGGRGLIAFLADHLAGAVLVVTY